MAPGMAPVSLSRWIGRRKPLGALEALQRVGGDRGGGGARGGRPGARGSGLARDVAQELDLNATHRRTPARCSPATSARDGAVERLADRGGADAGPGSEQPLGARWRYRPGARAARRGGSEATAATSPRPGAVAGRRSRRRRRPGRVAVVVPALVADLVVAELVALDLDPAGAVGGSPIAAAVALDRGARAGRSRGAARRVLRAVGVELRWSSVSVSHTVSVQIFRRCFRHLQALQRNAANPPRSQPRSAARPPSSGHRG